MEEIIAEIGSPSFSELAGLIAAIGALGAAAAGLVDTTKFFSGGISNAGFEFIRKALKPFHDALSRAVGAEADWVELLRAHWLNGRSKDDQKAIAKSLVRLGLHKDNAGKLANAGSVDPGVLEEAADALQKGRDLSPEAINALGRFDTAVEARLDAAFERADQYYRNASKLLSGVVAVILSLIAGGVLYFDMAGQAASISGYMFGRYCVLALIVGIVAVPLAPVSKDLVSALGTAVKAMKAAKG